MDVVNQLNRAIKSGRVRTVLAFFSGGKDSAVASYIGYRFAQVMKLDFKLVHINTTINVPETEEYVEEYAKWLGVELVVLKPEKTFEEYVALYPYWPNLHHARWCYYYLKVRPLAKYLSQYPEYTVLQVTGIRRNESLTREKKFNYHFDVVCDTKHGRPCNYVWHPILHLSNVERLVRQFGIPRNPVWDKLGFSGECLCLAGMPKSTLDRLIRYYPDVAERLMKIDDIIHAHRQSKETSFPPPIRHLRIRLKDYIQMKMKENEKQTTLDMFVYEGKSCDSCLFEKGEG